MAQQERARRTRAAIVEAAAYEFSKRGYTAASVNTILEGSRATKGAMYFHFSSKEELARAVLQTAMEKYVAIMDVERPSGMDALEWLHDLIIQLARSFDENVVVRAEFRLVVEPEFHASIREGAGAVWGRTAHKLAAEAHETGLLRPDIDPRMFTRVLVTSLAGQRYMADLTAEDTDLVVLFEESLEVLLMAMASREWLDKWRVDGWPRVDAVSVET
ncbi:TetR family transcriptional regulator [Rhodococcus sp. BP-349]|uniref:ScbR family autoregulator-binding transcription factor n=1 Tax=unclassified Rhodococcus (in: high G+C Gram-positive bacteria) TaxID=192944 RepID=UPI001C9B65D6|nr:MULTISPECIES: ScbR family autoregulator-binding transcription factor [unclassified Rhodococcus (in: high G+C Gram-positive bacteria)]MBY6538176.1 TetR family transcriptional regulator [Rhodococcus sp. BP-363]MBY6542513.1 TetR family transcriptional regulator [Rhodococcus sp. BP-369]MBY6561743.1 TetR family transcriptional regulator [Rhodococcus sp. BP-370]MBY6576035.1 TetR family transcriptional regulator [Rhodococcus sp. BP-364]MBY6585336.1 TetR family transcriptional regulator [Rhodococcu